MRFQSVNLHAVSYSSHFIRVTNLYLGWLSQNIFGQRRLSACFKSKMASETRVSNQERYFFHNNLSILLKAVEGKKTTVDFRNEASITGFVEQVDGYMNIVMKDCIFVDPRGSEFNYDMFFVHARNIRYVHIPQQELKKSRLTYLITGSNADFANFTASFALGSDWKSLFDVIICYAKKPGFFTGSRPFLTVEEDHSEGEAITGGKLRRGGTYSQGNWEELKAFFAKESGKTSPACLYVGDNLIQDIYTPKRYADCDTVAIVEEQLAEGMQDHILSHSDEQILNSKIWGSYFHIENKDNGLHPSLWSHVINSYSKICLPSVDFIVNNSLDTPLKTFGIDKDKKLCGFHPAKPKSVAML